MSNKPKQEEAVRGTLTPAYSSELDLPVKERFLAELQRQLAMTESELRQLEGLSQWGSDHVRFALKHHRDRIATLKASIRRYTA